MEQLREIGSRERPVHPEKKEGCGGRKWIGTQLWNGYSVAITVIVFCVNYFLAKIPVTVVFQLKHTICLLLFFVILREMQVFFFT